MRALPAGVEPTGNGYYIAGNNHSDDLFMFLKRKLGPADGVQPNTAYRLKFKIVFASNAPSGCLGIGGAPGEGVTHKLDTRKRAELPVPLQGASVGSSSSSKLGREWSPGSSTTPSSPTVQSRSSSRLAAAG
jgi:hypothetical protein